MIIFFIKQQTTFVSFGMMYTASFESAYVCRQNYGAKSAEIKLFPRTIACCVVRGGSNVHICG